MTSENNTANPVLFCEDSELSDDAVALGEELGLAVVDEPSKDALVLVLSSRGLYLKQWGTKIGEVGTDFLAGQVAHRRRFGGGKGQDIAKAVGVGKGLRDVVDLTAGLGRDAIVLATLGCRVRMVERVPIVAALLRDGLRRAQESDELSEIGARMSLVNQDARAWLERVIDEERPEVCYLDPMYPHSRKSALPAKEMLLFRAFVGGDSDAATLLDGARRVARARVVVKRPRKAPFLGDVAPAFQIVGKSTRFDVYLPIAEPKA